MATVIRKNIAHLSATERTNFLNAILALKNSRFYLDGVSFWDKQDEIHQATHVHGGPAFIPWHRELCNRFEELLQQVDPTLALHYWDWTTDPRATPDLFSSPINLFTSSFMGSSSGLAGVPFSSFGTSASLTRGISGIVPTIPGIAPDTTILLNLDYPNFRNALESAHNTIHGYIGGTIGNSHTAFEDPFVFLLHSNLDRLFAMWQIQNGQEWRLDPNQVYGTEGSHISITENMEPWDGVSGLRPWAAPDNQQEVKNCKTPSVVKPPIYDSMNYANLIIKDFPSDIGTEPSTGGVYWETSDIVVRPTDHITLSNFDSHATDFSLSSRVTRGQDNFIFVRVTNLGPKTASNVVVDIRITPWVGTQFAYPNDWITINSTHIVPSPLLATFASINAGDSVIAKFNLNNTDISTMDGWSPLGWHPCLLAKVVSTNDFAFFNPTSVNDNISMRKNNLAQKNLSIVDIASSFSGIIRFPFIAGNFLNRDKFMEIIINKGRLPKTSKVRLVIDSPKLDFPGLKLKKLVPIGDINLTNSKLDLKKNIRYVNLEDKFTKINLSVKPKQMYQMKLEIQLPIKTDKGQQFPIQVMQINTKNQIVGGATVVIIT